MAPKPSVVVANAMPDGKRGLETGSHAARTRDDHAFASVMGGPFDRVAPERRIMIRRANGDDGRAARIPLHKQRKGRAALGLAAVALHTVILSSLAGCSSSPPAAFEAAARPGSALSEDQAKHKALGYIGGDVYGYNIVELGPHIVKQTLLPAPAHACSLVARPVWAFHITNPYDGWLYLDASSGEKICSTIPFYR